MFHLFLLILFLLLISINKFTCNNSISCSSSFSVYQFYCTNV
ncbi:hypothetical protein KSF78_0001140 [Schistosoma japonicum]|nr:hypothetical protein KSF78_0001140 [Schistosoma japonicum]